MPKPKSSSGKLAPSIKPGANSSKVSKPGSKGKTGSGNSKLGKIAPNVPGRKKSPSSNLPKTKEEERKDKREQARQRRKQRADKRATRSVKAASLAANIAAPGSGKIVKAVGNNPVAKKLISTSIRIKMVIGALVAAALVLVIIIPGFAMATFTSGLSLPQKMALDTASTIAKKDMAAKAEELDVLGSDTKDFSAMPIAASATMMDNPMQDGNGGASDANLPEGDAGAVIEVAKHWIGVPYVGGGDTPKGWDCSGFTMGVYRTALGLVIPHQSQAQRSKGKEVSYSEAKPGDLMVSPRHVMIFLGKADGGKAYTIHSPKPGGKVNMGLRSASYVSQFQFYRMFNNTATADYIPSPSEPTSTGFGSEHPTYQLNAFDNWAISNGYFNQTSSKAYPKEAIAGTVPSEGATKTSFKGYIEVKPAVANFATSLIPFSPSPSPSQSETPDQAPDLKESEAPTPSESDSAADTSNALSASDGTGQILGAGVGPMHLKEGVLDEEKAKSLSTSNRFLSCVVDKIAGTGTDPFRFAAGWKKSDRDRKIVDQDEYDKAKKTGAKIMQMLPLDGIDESKAGRLFDKASKWYNGKQVSEACEEDEVVSSTEAEQAGVGGQTTPTDGDAIKVTGPDGKEKTLSGEEYSFVSEVASKVGGTDMGVDQRVGAIEWAILHTNAKDKVDGVLEKIKSEWDDGKSIGENVYKAAGDLSASDYDVQEAPARQLAGSGATALTKCGTVGGPGCAGGKFNKDKPLEDSAVYGGPGMSQEQIQAFLDKKGSWLAKNKVDTNTKAPDQFCKGYESSGQELPSEIIYKTAKSCDVKAQWILTRLQAEQGLITKKTEGNLRSAMGYGCPDGQKCAAEYYGFFNQVWWGSRQVQVYKKGKYKDSLPIGQQQTDLEGIPYTPQNDAARVLYLYTPHTSAAKDTFTIYKDYFPCSAVDENKDGNDGGAQNAAFKGYFEATPAIGHKSPDGGFKATPVDNEYGWDGKFSKPYTGPNPRVTSPYGYRIHPVTGQRKKHNGVDLGLAEGVPQYAAAPGVVEFAKPYSTCGNAVKIKHGEFKGHQWATMYCHLSGMNVTAGQKVQAGTKIGITGHTGRVTGAHMHFEVQQDGVAIEPTRFIFDGKEATPQEGMSNDGGSADGSNDGGLSSEEVKKAHDAWVACGGRVPVSSYSAPSLEPITGTQE
ncbi:peptidoglycan DD-metalloendopeptidase family protein, partial [uncultured Varibaculum sp.]|uniref:peptidoglycan DD-metalloendopeptidase family protein n=1 Tax=uncultured Varibaculum sp. TaxID=413896 RepID=UPI00288AFEB1